jgi:hypothetical protein
VLVEVREILASRARAGILRDATRRISSRARRIGSPAALERPRKPPHAVGVISGVLPRCGLYRTVAPIGSVPPGRLVYFHDHGDPGPGVYFPERWTANRAHFSPKGTALPLVFDPSALLALPAEGFYRVASAFFCCEKQCVRFEPEAFVQLGYNGAGRALLFAPELWAGAITLPERGTLIDDTALANLVALRVAERREDIALPRGILVH